VTKVNKRSAIRQQGFTVIELMIALLISSVVIGGIFAVFINTKKTQRFTSELAQIQESGRFALAFLKRDIRMIDYQGCNSSGSLEINIVDNAMSVSDFAKQKVVGYKIKANWKTGSAFATASDITAKLGSDAFSIGRIRDLPDSIVIDSTTNTTVELTNNTSYPFKQHEMLLVSDCESSDIFKVTAAPTVIDADDNSQSLSHTSAAPTGNAISKLYDSSAVLSHYQNTLYYVTNTGRKNPHGEDVFALNRAIVTAASTPTFKIEELIEGVEHMTVLYGEQLASGNTRYVPADQVSPAINWDNVTSVKIAVLVTSHQGVRNTEDDSSYQLLTTELVAPTSEKTTLHSGGKRLKKVFSTTINIRNRME